MSAVKNPLPKPANAPFEAVAKSYRKKAGVTAKKMFGTSALCIRGKVFAFPWKEAAVFKLPKEAVEGIVKGKQGILFDPGHGRTSKEWVEVGAASKKSWSKWAAMAHAFVGQK